MTAPGRWGTPGDLDALVDPHDYYRAMTAGTLAERFFHPRRTRLVADLVPAEGRILDLGASTGPMAIPWREQRRDVVAVELSFEHLSNLGRYAARRGVEVACVQADAGALPFADGSFPIVVLASLVHLLPTPGPALREAERVCAPGGILIVAGPWRWHPKSSRALKTVLRGGRPPDARSFPFSARGVAAHLPGCTLESRRLDPLLGYLALAFRRGA